MAINLHAVVNNTITGIHPDETVILRQSLGQVDVRGRMVPMYDRPRAVSAQIQPLSPETLAHVEQVSSTKLDRKAYLFSPVVGGLTPAGIVRPLARGGDMLQRADGSWWLVSQVLEDYSKSGWVCVGLVRQIDPPDLSMSEG